MAKKNVPPSFASRLNSLIAPLAPSLALRRETAFMRRQMLLQQAGHFQGAGRTARGKDFRANRTDAVEAIRGDRERMSWIGRDMLRNNPRVKRIRRQLVNNVVAAGIQYSINWKGDDDDPRKATLEKVVKDHCGSTRFDADGLKTMMGMHGLAFGTIVTDGEVLLRRRYRPSRDGLPLNFQVQILEPDFLNRNIDGDLRGGAYAVEGVEFNAEGQRTHYHLYTSHPGGRRGGMPASRRIEAKHIIHAFEVDRPGQVRGMTWLAPVITLLHEIQKYQDGQVKRQEIAALFAGILKTGETAEDLEEQLGTIEAGSILTIGDDEEMSFTNPPSVDGYEPFMRVTDRVIAAAMGITFEAMTGDYSQVNFASGRMGRMDVDPNVKDWQQNLMIARICMRLAEWTSEGVEDVTGIDASMWEMIHTPPVRPVIDPSKEYKADEIAMRTGQKSRRQTIRERGGDPDKVEAEIVEERKWANDNDVVLSSDARAASPSAVSNDTPPKSKENEDE